MSMESFADEWCHEDPLITAAREHGSGVPGGQATPATGGLLRALALATGARAVVQAGGDGGVSSLYLLEGMSPDGILTSIEPLPAVDQVTRDTFRKAGTGHRVRAITGNTLDVLSRLADRAYDLMVVGANIADRGEHLQAARRLLHPGSPVIFLGVLGREHAVLDPSRRDDQTSTARLFLAEVADDPSLTATLVPIGTGALIAFLFAEE